MLLDVEVIFVVFIAADRGRISWHIYVTLLETDPLFELSRGVNEIIDSLISFDMVDRTSISHFQKEKNGGDEDSQIQ